MSPPELARRTDDPEVGCERDHRAGAGGDAVDRGDDRDWALAHGPDDVAGHLREPHEVAGLHGDQLADDLVDVTAATEPAALPPDDQDADVLVMRQFGEQVAQVGVALEGQRVELLGSVESDGGDAVGLAEPKVLPVFSQLRRCAEAVVRAHRSGPLSMRSRAMIERCISEAPS
jgi:hypothetical protein